MPDLSKITVGMSLYVTGRMRASTHTGSDGNDRYYYEVLANKVRFVTDEDNSRQ